MTNHARIAVFASGSGTNLQALLDHFHADSPAGGRVELVIGSRPGIGALARADAAGVASLVIDPAAGPDATVSALASHRIDLIVLAGYLKLVPLEVVQAYPGRMINIHPALLPAFGGPGMYGLRVHRAVIESGARVSGATVHVVGERYDEGPILAQWPVPVLTGDTPERLAARILRVEHLLLPAAVEALVAAPGPGEADGAIHGVADRERGGAEDAVDGCSEVFELGNGAVPTMASVRRLNSR